MPDVAGTAAEQQFSLEFENTLVEIPVDRKLRGTRRKLRYGGQIGHHTSYPVGRQFSKGIYFNPRHLVFQLTKPFRIGYFRGLSGPPIPSSMNSKPAKPRAAAADSPAATPSFETALTELESIVEQ